MELDDFRLDLRWDNILMILACNLENKTSIVIYYLRENFVVHIVLKSMKQTKFVFGSILGETFLKNKLPKNKQYWLFVHTI